jgi:hypothetical protein
MDMKGFDIPVGYMERTIKFYGGSSVRWFERYREAEGTSILYELSQSMTMGSQSFQVGLLEGSISEAPMGW